MPAENSTARKKSTSTTGRRTTSASSRTKTAARRPTTASSRTGGGALWQLGTVHSLSVELPHARLGGEPLVHPSGGAHLASTPHGSGYASRLASAPAPANPGLRRLYPLSRLAFATTESELSDMAPAAIIGLSSSPITG